MGKIATNIDEQLDLLEGRGMVLGDRDKAKEYLLDIGYYRLGFYWHYFETDAQHNFLANTKVETIRELYYFDFDLKYLLSKYIYRIEVHFRTQLVYLVSNKHKDTPTWFIDKKSCFRGYN
jgi:abortive infection bacteriophage resistance protein